MTRKALLLLPALAFPASAHAQFSVYGTVTLNHMTGISSSPVLNTLTPGPCTTSVTTDCTAYKNSVNPIGFTGGASYEFKTIGLFTLAADVRGGVNNSHQGAQTEAQGSGTHIYFGLGGIKAEVKTPLNFLTPYVEGAVGYGRSNYGVLTNAQVSSSATDPGVVTQNSLEYNIYAGADLHALPWADWRVVELGYGALQAGGTYSHNYPLYSISTGVVFHIPARQ
jgi:hypothetical protein